MHFAETFIRRPVLSSMISLGLVLIGLIGYSRLPVREFPDADPPIVSVSVLLPGARVGAGAVVERAILGADAAVGAGARVEDLAVLGDRATVADGLRVSGGSVGVEEHLAVEPA